MNRWIGSALAFLLMLGVLQLARLAVLVFSALEVIAMLGLWFWAIAECSIHGIMSSPVDSCWGDVARRRASILVAVHLAAACTAGRPMEIVAEFFSRAVRYPVVCTPHPWE